jgi:hypothetical protein
MNNLPRLQKDNIIIALENIIIPGTGITFFIFKGQKYKLETFLDKWKEPAWFIININAEKDYNFFPSNKECGWFTENELFEKFNCLKYNRKLKLMKLNESWR